jgi:hypothetical protein
MMTSMSLKDKYNVLVSGKYQDLFLIFRTMSSKLKIRKYFDYNVIQYTAIMYKDLLNNRYNNNDNSCTGAWIHCWFLVGSSSSSS